MFDFEVNEKVAAILDRAYAEIHEFSPEHPSLEVLNDMSNMCNGSESDDDPNWGDDDGLSDMEADAMALASAGMGTDEDYGRFGEIE